MEQFRADMQDMFKEDDRATDLEIEGKRQRFDQEKQQFEMKMLQQEADFQMRLEERRIANANSERQLAMQEVMMAIMQKFLNNNNNNN